MDLMYQLPFKVGDIVESRCFSKGYRGAWFRCEVKRITYRKGYRECLLEYFDFPDEKEHWVRMYQKPPKCIRSEDEDLVPMLRPTFPIWCMETQISDQHYNGLMAVVSDDWIVGDLVDWRCDSCYWSAKITQVHGDGKVEIKLPPPPFGEGDICTAECKDLRPSLVWTLNDGWTVPIQDWENTPVRCSVRLLYPNNAGMEGTKSGTSKAPLNCKGRCSSATSDDVPIPADSNSNSKKQKNKRHLSEICSEAPKVLVESPVSTNVLASCTSSNVEVPAEPSVSDLRDNIAKPTSSNKMPVSKGSECLSGTSSLDDGETSNSADQLPSSYDEMKKAWMSNPWFSVATDDDLDPYILQLEELLLKIRWLKGLLHHGPEEPSFQLHEVQE